jgi:hypothetical protein
MLAAGASLTVVPVPPGCLAALPLLAWGALGAGGWPGAAACPAVPEAADELAVLPPEHPTRNSPAASMTPPIARTPVLGLRPVGLDRQFRLRVSAMPL